MGSQSILESFLRSADERTHDTAALVKEASRFVPVTWGEMRHEVLRIARSLLACGIMPGDRIAIMMQTRLEWALVDMAICYAGAISVPIYASNLAEDCRFMIEDSATKLVICEDGGQTDKFLGQAQAHMPSLTHVVQLVGGATTAAVRQTHVLAWKSFLELGREVDDELEKRRAAISKHSPYSIIYTSGTTGLPKGVIATHDNMLYEAEAIEQLDMLRRTDTELLFLPLAHVFSRVLEVAWLGIGHVMAFAESMNSIRDDMALVKPQVLAGVPRVFEKFYLAVVKSAQSRGSLTRLAFDRAQKLSEQVGEEAMAHLSQQRDTKAAGSLAHLELALWRKTVLAKVGRGLKQTMGGQMRLLVSGGAPLSTKVAWFFSDAGIEILEGYGLSETMGGTCVNRLGKNRIGTVGLPLPGTEASLAEDGELMLRGRGISPGYWNNEAASKELFADGWLKTGDIAAIDRDGCVRIVDRKKDLIITAGGKNVAPQLIENLLKTHPLISQALVHGDKRNYLTAVLTLDAEALAKFAETQQLGRQSHAELTQRPEVLREVETAVATFNQQLPRYETIKKFKILPHDFTVESGELTPSLKVKRRECNRRYKTIFDGFYEERG